MKRDEWRALVASGDVILGMRNGKRVIVGGRATRSKSVDGCFSHYGVDNTRSVRNGSFETMVIRGGARYGSAAKSQS
jgi:hypothetical protein